MKANSVNYDFYNSKKWRKLSADIKRRDNHECQLCKRYGKSSRAEITHHIIEVNDDWDKRFDKDNLISLCSSCHNKVHGNEYVRG